MQDPTVICTIGTEAKLSRETIDKELRQRNVLEASDVLLKSNDVHEDTERLTIIRRLFEAIEEISWKTNPETILFYARHLERTAMYLELLGKEMRERKSITPA